MPDHEGRTKAANENNLSATHLQNCKQGGVLTLPEGQEDDRLDHQELEHGAVRAEQLPGGEIEQEEGVQRQADGDVVDDGDIQITTGNTVEREHVRENSIRPVFVQIAAVCHSEDLNLPLEINCTIKRRGREEHKTLD